jgi:hypothetical protein
VRRRADPSKLHAIYFEPGEIPHLHVMLDGARSEVDPILRTISGEA